MQGVNLGSVAQPQLVQLSPGSQQVQQQQQPPQQQQAPQQWVSATRQVNPSSPTLGPSLIPTSGLNVAYPSMQSSSLMSSQQIGNYMSAPLSATSPDPLGSATSAYGVPAYGSVEDLYQEIQQMKVKQNREFAFLLNEVKRREHGESVLRTDLEMLRNECKSVVEQMTQETMQKLEGLGDHRGGPVETSQVRQIQQDLRAYGDRLDKCQRGLEQLQRQVERNSGAGAGRVAVVARPATDVGASKAPMEAPADPVTTSSMSSDSDKVVRVVRAGGATSTLQRPDGQQVARLVSAPEVQVVRSVDNKLQTNAAAAAVKPAVLDVEKRVREIEARGNLAFNLKTGGVTLLSDFEFTPGNQETPRAGFLDPQRVAPILDDLAALASLFGTCILEAHSRKKGTPFWQTLANNRADLVAGQLVSRGVSADKIAARGSPGKVGKANRHMTIIMQT
mmetsp:Transcript_58773/g.108492  ORF Transcript_58773/g.108492 Transcript_58773/m.108492 type:complete len:448 (-) Transcript_58773:126-1469(-)